MNRAHAILVASLAAAPAALAQPGSDIRGLDKYSWGENIGWLNWRDAGDPQASQGVRLGAASLSGFVWGENVGWIHLGDGTPADTFQYANTTGADFGVNMDPVTGHLSGLAWGENIGWINFSGGAMANPAVPARYDAGAMRFYGYAWGENVGWINLNDPVHFVGTLCPADYNRDGFVDGIDYDLFNNDFEAGIIDADFNRDSFLDGIDYDQFNNHFEAGC